MDNPQNVISFCTGYGGLELGIGRAGVDVRIVCNVEIEAFVQANLVAKTEEGRMDNAPIWTDLKTFPASIFRGKVRGITGGYPCQPFSSAGKRKGEEDPRHLWPYIRKHVRTIRPLWCFSRTSEVTSRWGYGESCPIWKKMVTERSGDCSARRKRARLTNASDASSWPTATARDHKGCYKTLVRKDGKPRGDLLPDAVNIAEQNWPTPRAGNPGSRKPGTGGKILAEEAKIHAGPPAPEKSSTSGKNHGSPKLNPNWVEQLMGLEVGWTQLPTAWIGSDS